MMLSENDAGGMGWPGGHLGFGFGRSRIVESVALAPAVGEASH